MRPSSRSELLVWELVLERQQLEGALTDDSERLSQTCQSSQASSTAGRSSISKSSFSFPLSSLAVEVLLLEEECYQ